jgi:hypothetical protein
MRSETRALGGCLVTVTQLPCLRSLALLPKLHLLDDIGLASGAELQALARELLSGVTVQKGGARIDLIGDDAIHAALGGDVKTLLDVMRFAAEVNFFPTSTESAPGDQPAQGGG